MIVGQIKFSKRERMLHAAVLLLLGLAHLAWASPTSEPLSLTIALPQVGFGESNITLHVTMTNRSSLPITLFKSNPGCDFIAEVKDANGLGVPLTETGAELGQCKENATLGRRIRVILNPGQSTEDTYPIDLYYHLARPGRYAVQLMREVPAQSKHLARSNEVMLNLAE